MLKNRITRRVEERLGTGALDLLENVAGRVLDASLAYSHRAAMST